MNKELIEKLYSEEELKIGTISKRLGISASKIRRILIESGVLKVNLSVKMKLKVKELYEEDKTIPMIVEELKLKRHVVREVLYELGVYITKSNRLRVFSEEHKQKISESKKGQPGFWKDKKMPDETNRKNMINHMKFDITLEDIVKYGDTERLKALNKALYRDRVKIHFDKKKYLAYLERVYKDEAFNKIYDLWIDTGKIRWTMLSLDHIVPLSRGGTYDLDNLQFLTWFENRAKADMTMSEWREFKRETNTTSSWFIDEIINRH